MSVTNEQVGSFENYISEQELSGDPTAVEKYTRALIAQRLGKAAELGISPEELHQSSF